MQNYVDLAMRAHYDAAADQVVLYPVKDKHPNLAGARVNLKRGTPTDDKLRLHLNAAGLLADEQVPSGSTLDSWANMPGVQRSDVQLLKLLLKSDDPIAFVTAKGSAGTKLRSACAFWSSKERHKDYYVTFAGTAAELASRVEYLRARGDGRTLPEEIQPLLDEDGFVARGYAQINPPVMQVEGLRTLTQARWLSENVPAQLLVALPQSLSEGEPQAPVGMELDFEPGVPVLDKNGRYSAPFKAGLNAYLQGAYGAIVYVTRGVTTGWAFEIDIDLPPVKKPRPTQEAAIAW